MSTGTCRVFVDSTFRCLASAWKIKSTKQRRKMFLSFHHPVSLRWQTAAVQMCLAYVITSPATYGMCDCIFEQLIVLKLKKWIEVSSHESLAAVNLLPTLCSETLPASLSGLSFHLTNSPQQDYFSASSNPALPHQKLFVEQYLYLYFPFKVFLNK